MSVSPHKGTDAALDFLQPQLSRVVYGGLVCHTDEDLFDKAGVRVAFTERTGGVSKPPYQSLNLADHVGDDLAAVRENRAIVLDTFGLSRYAHELVNPRQVHGDEVFVVDASGQGTYETRQDADAVICMVPRVPVLLCYADCMPVVLVAPEGRFAVIHAGWRGALAGIVGKTALMLSKRASCEASSIVAYLGPHIRACCYETSPDILGRFVAKYGISCDAGQNYLSLNAVVRTDLISHGIGAGRIAEVFDCTSCATDRFFSYRSEAGVCGRHAALACQVD